MNTLEKQDTDTIISSDSGIPNNAQILDSERSSVSQSTNNLNGGLKLSILVDLAVNSSSKHNPTQSFIDCESAPSHHKQPTPLDDHDEGFGTDSQSISVTNLSPLYNAQSHTSFSLSNGHKMIVRFRQQPKRSRMIGFAEKDRRPIDPPPVLELICLDLYGNRIDCSSICQDFVACAALYCKDGRLDRSFIRQNKLDAYPYDTTRIYNSLEGETDANCQVLLDEKGMKSCYFIFPQLSVRIRGEFRLKFVIVNPREAESSSTKNCPMMAQILSDPFVVYTIKDFPGVKGKLHI